MKKSFYTKFLVIFSMVLITMGITAVISIPNTSNAEKLAIAEVTQHIQEPLDKNALLRFDQGLLTMSLTDSVEKRFGSNFDKLNKENTKINLTLRFTTKEKNQSNRYANVTGNVYVLDRSYGFIGDGYFIPFTIDGIEYYAGLVDGQLKGANRLMGEPDFDEYDHNNSSIYIIF